MYLIDSHCHLDDPRFDVDRDAVLQRAVDVGVDAIIIPATTAARWSRLRQLAATHPELRIALGLHPMFMREHECVHPDQLREQLASGEVVAVGECGLDYFRGREDAQSQRDLLMQQLKLAREFDLPVILHARRALDEVMQCLREVGSLRGVVHSFSGSAQQAAQLWELGFLLGVGGPVTHERARRLRSIVAMMPIEHLLLETDAPDQPGALHRGQRNEPAWLVGVLQTVATLRGEAERSVAEATSSNARRLFALARVA